MTGNNSNDTNANVTAKRGAAIAAMAIRHGAAADGAVKRGKAIDAIAIKHAEAAVSVNTQIVAGIAGRKPIAAAGGAIMRGAVMVGGTKQIAAGIDRRVSTLPANTIHGHAAIMAGISVAV